MSDLEALWDSFEDRNLVLQGLLGLLSVTEAAAVEARSQAGASLESSLTEPLHPLVLLMLGVISARDTLHVELASGLGEELVALPLTTPTRGASSAPLLLEILR